MTIRFAFLIAAMPALLLAVEPSIYYWRTSLGGTIRAGGEGRPGTMNDVDRDLGHGDPDAGIGLQLQIGRDHQFVFDRFNLDLSASREIDQDIDFGGTVFPEGTRLSSSVEGNLLRIAYRYCIGSDEFRAGFLVGLNWIDVNLAARDEAGNKTDDSFSSGMPLAGGLIESTPHPNLRFRASLAAGSWRWASEESTVLDLDAGAHLQLEPLFVGLGYRYIRMSGEQDRTPSALDLVMRGPVFVAGLSF